MPPVRTLLFLAPLVKALRPSTTPAKQLSTASNMKALVASQKAMHKETMLINTNHIMLKPFFELSMSFMAQSSSSPTVKVWAWHLWLMQNLQSP